MSKSTTESVCSVSMMAAVWGWVRPKLMEMASWLTEDQLAALIVVAEQLKGK